jgi:hypothetical protein
MKVMTVSSLYLMNIYICREQILIFYNKPTKRKNIKRRKWENFKIGKQLSAGNSTSTPSHNSNYSLL